MGKVRKEGLQVDFDSQIKPEFLGAAITSDPGLAACRELDEASGRLRQCASADPPRAGMDAGRTSKRPFETVHLAGTAESGRGRTGA